MEWLLVYTLAFGPSFFFILVGLSGKLTKNASEEMTGAQREEELAAEIRKQEGYRDAHRYLCRKCGEESVYPRPESDEIRKFNTRTESEAV